MVRHAGLHLPDVRGLGFTQHAARIVAAGLLVVVPMFSTPNRAIARGDTTLTPLPRAAAAVVVEQVAPALPSAPSDHGHGRACGLAGHGARRCSSHRGRGADGRDHGRCRWPVRGALR